MDQHKDRVPSAAGVPDEVLGAARTALVRLSALLATRDRGPLRAHLDTLSEDGVQSVWVEEAILQSYLFLGYPTALNAMADWREVNGAPAASDRAAADHGEWDARGARICEVVYGGQYEGLRENVRRLHPDMEMWMVSEGYGKVLGRDGLDLRTRELCIVAQLAVLDVPRQLYSHLRGALNTGASQDEVDCALHIGLTHVGEAVAEAARDTWATVRSRTRS